MHIEDTGFGHLEIFYRKWHSHLASSPYLSSTINSYSIVDVVITVCFEGFHETTTTPNVNNSNHYDNHSFLFKKYFYIFNNKKETHNFLDCKTNYFEKYLQKVVQLLVCVYIYNENYF